jgi:hypothetical protein
MKIMKDAVRITGVQPRFNFSTSKSRWAGHMACMREKRNTYRVLVGKPEGKKPLPRPRCTWEDNIKMDLKIIGCSGMNWTHEAHNRDL